MSERPSAAEVARTLTAGHGTASVGTAFGASAAPVLHAALDDGEIVLLASRRDLAGIGLAELVGPVRPSSGQDRVVLVDVRSYAPLPDLTLVRAQLSAAGWARLASANELQPATAALVAVFGPEVASLAGPCSDRVVLVVDVAECELHWPQGCVRIDAEDYVLAEVDPLAALESAALERITAQSSDRLLAMVRRLRPDLTGGEDLSAAISVRPIGLDRYGLTLQCSLPGGDAGLGRLAFPLPRESVEEAEATIIDLLDHHEHCQVR